MTKEHYFKKVRQALVARQVKLDLNMAETLNVIHLWKSGFSPISAAKVIIDGRLGPCDFPIVTVDTPTTTERETP